MHRGTRLQESEAVRTSVEVIVEVEIERPPPTVWSFVTDTERLPEWLGGFEAPPEGAEGPPGGGAVGPYTPKPRHRAGTVDNAGMDPPRRRARGGPPPAAGAGRARPAG